MSSRIKIDDYYPHNMKQRYGGLKPFHAEIDAILAKKRESYKETLEGFVKYVVQLQEISLTGKPGSSLEPYWNNGFLPGPDALAVYGFISEKRPKLYIEVGSGHSTKFAAQAIRFNSPATRIISIDPYPRAEIDALCETVIRERLEECDLELFEALEPGDIVFFDGSHRVLQNSDNTVFFLEVIPRLKAGVLIHLHDIPWPFDYPDEWSRRMYSEQYVLGAMLLYAHEKFEIMLPNAYISWRTNLKEIFNLLWQTPGLDGISAGGSSFWFTKKG
ncbi:MAG: class I SAM-dependent methyltransferase [Deltaproteobacteria bacterium]|nr:class I SAM-dependent methyltransferase [Deltaproteobacteria bacterium]